MTSCSILFSCLKGDVTRAGRDVKRHCPSLYALSNTFSSVVWYRFSIADTTACHHVTASYVLWRVSNVGTWPAWWGGKTDGWRWTALHWDQPVASVMHSLDSDVNEPGTVTLRNFTAYMLALLLIALICPSCSIQTQACFRAHHP